MNNINEMSLKEKIGQMLLIGLDMDLLNDEVMRIIREYKVGGVVVYQRNYSNINNMMDFVNKLKCINKDNYPLFIAIDQENGLVNRLPKDILRMPSQKKQAEYEMVEEYSRITGDILRSVGINMNLAPVVDIARNIKDRVSYMRCYGMRVEDILENARIAIDIYKSMEIIPVIKHFPGHGLVKGDSHFVLPKIRNVDELRKKDSYIFRELIKDKNDVLMIGHLRVAGYGFKPATMNKDIINDYLGEYDGLIMTDDIKMNFLKYLYGTKNVIINCINSSDDIIMMKYQRGDLRKLNKVVKKVENDLELQDRVNISVEKILNIKEKYHLSNEIVNLKVDANEINKKIELLNLKMKKD